MAVTPVAYPIRRERWFPHISAEQKRSYFTLFQLDLEAGVGLSAGPAGAPVQGQDPIVMLDWSDDGGHTFSDVRQMQAGAAGDYTHRLILFRLGMSRDRIFRFATSDPIQWSIINGYVRVQAGRS